MRRPKIEIPEHPKDTLAAALKDLGLADLATKAADGFYHDGISPLALPALQLSIDLLQVGTDEARTVRQRHLAGEFSRPHPGRQTIGTMTEPR